MPRSVPLWAKPWRRIASFLRHFRDSTVASALLMRRFMRHLLLAVGLLFTACSSSSSDSGTTADGSTDASTDTASGCITPKEGAACKSTDVLCPGFEGGCCAGFLWTCDATKGWVRSGLGCPCTSDASVDTSTTDAADAADTKVGDGGAFACGTAKTCAPGDFCKEQAPGIPGPDGGTLPSTFDCNPMPDACTSTPTCDCVKANVPGCTGICNTDARGNVTMHCMGA
jgi:hypothetical protein